MFTVTSEARSKLVRVKINAMLTPELVAELYRQEREAVHAMNCRPGEHLCIVDLSECPLQLQDVVGAFQTGMKSGGRSRRLAVFTGQALARMQARRVLQRADAAMFETREEAEAWLFSADLSKAA